MTIAGVGSEARGINDALEVFCGDGIRGHVPCDTTGPDGVVRLERLGS